MKSEEMFRIISSVCLGFLLDNFCSLFFYGFSIYFTLKYTGLIKNGKKKKKKR